MASTIYFPLRTSVEMFDDPTSPSAPARVKEAAVLYDRLVIETGLYDATITDNGSTEFWTPPGQITPEQIEHSRTPVPVGEEMILSIAPEAYPGGPVAGKSRVTMRGTIGHRYIAEFHSGILDELEKFTSDWVETVPLGGTDKPFRSDTEPAKALRRLNFEDLGANDLMPDADEFLRKFAYKSFNRDAVMASELGASFSMSPLFRDVAARRGASRDLAGDTALRFAAPLAGALPWEAVIEFREHPGAQEARSVLRGFEEKALEEPIEAAQFMPRVHAEVSRALFAASDDLAPKWTEELRSQIASTAISMIPIVGGIAAGALSIGGAIAGQRRYERSWNAALMVLQPRI